MDTNDLKTLEEKTRSIVATLGNLEMETREYQKKNVDIVSGINNLSSVSEQVAAASKELSSAAALFSSSDFSTAIKEIDSRIDQINKAEVVFSDQSKAIGNLVEEVLTENKRLSSDLDSANKNLRELLEMHNTLNETKQLLEMVTIRIARIDRNTQKGFGKERG